MVKVILMLAREAGGFMPKAISSSLRKKKKSFRNEYFLKWVLYYFCKMYNLPNLRL